MLKGVLTIQALVLLVYGVPYFLAPRFTTALTQQLPLPENYILRALGVQFIMLAVLELWIARDLERYRGLVFAYGLLPALLLLTILLQAFVRGFNGAAWFWMLNAAVAAIFTLAVFAAHRQA